MKDSYARILRTLIQMVAALPVTVLSTWMVDQAGIPDGYAYPLAFAIVMVAQNVAEDLLGKGLLRPESPPTPATVEPVARVP